MAIPAIRALVAKYAVILGANGTADIKIRDNLGSVWLGRTTWDQRRPSETLIEVQRRVLADPRTLERVVAHEMVHHWEFTSLSDTDRALLRLRIRPSSHGSRFRQGAATVNAIMGDGFVSEKTDLDYATVPNRRSFSVLIKAVTGGRLGYQWAARLSPDATRLIAVEKALGARLVETANERWTHGPRIRRFVGWALPARGSEEETALRALYDGASAVVG